MTRVVAFCLGWWTGVMTYRQFLTEAALRRDVDRLLEEQAEWARKLVKDVEKAFGRGR